MARRGPDASGRWNSSDARVCLVHRRLSIIDPGASSDQPMVAGNGRWVIAFNGEIYNHRALRSDLEGRGHRFATGSDTEVIIALFAEHGPAACGMLDGMYAFAIHDRVECSLFLARDPYGIKPLYFADDGGCITFASQVGALLAGGIDDTLDPAGLAGFALLGHVPEPFTIRRAIRPLPAGHHLTIRDGAIGEPLAHASIAQGFAAWPDDCNARHLCHTALGDSIDRHLEADVEIGVFLSGGVDSGALLGAVRDRLGRPSVRAVTLAFDDHDGTKLDEAPRAALIARHYGADHHVERVGRGELAACLPSVLAAMDQPSIDGINTWLVSRAAQAAGLKVMLSGIGGDELFGGYSTFRTVPATVRAAAMPGAVPGFGRAARRLGAALLPMLAARNPKALAAFELGGTYAGAYLLRRGLFLPHELPAILGDELARQGLARLDPLGLIEASLPAGQRDPLMRVAALESGNYLKNQLLRDADWAGMAHGVEIRTPLVDHRLLKTVAPHLSSVMRTGGKALLATLPTRPLPPEILARPKTGFSVPAIGAVKGRLASRHWAARVLANFVEPRMAAA